MLDDIRSFKSLDTTPAFIIHRIARRLRVQLLRALQQFDTSLTPEKYFILLRCLEKPGISQIELSDKALNDQPNIKRLVDSLVQQGLLERHKHSVDARRYQIYISHSGNELLDKILPEIVRLRRQLYGDIDPDRLQITFETLQQIESKITAPEDQ